MSEPTETKNDPKVSMMCAFTVGIAADGTPYIVADLPANLEVTRAATLLDVRRAAAEILNEIQVNAVAERVATLLAPAPAPTPAEAVAAKLRERKESE